MFDMNNLPIIRTPDDLRDVMQLFDVENVTNERLYWFVAIGYAEQLSEYSVKDNARTILCGLKIGPINSDGAVMGFIETFVNDDITPEEQNDNNRSLLAAVARFYNQHDVSDKLMESPDDVRVIDLNHIEFDDDDGTHFEFINLTLEQMEGAINRILTGRPETFYHTQTWDKLNEDIPNHNRIIKDGKCYRYVAYMDGDGSFNWQVTIHLIPE